MTLLLDPIAVVTALLLLIARFVPVVMLTPVLGGYLVPWSVRIGLGIGLSAVMLPHSLALAAPASLTPSSLLMELAVGLTIGVASAVVFWGLGLAGQVITTSLMGLDDPGISSHPSAVGRTPLSTLLTLLVVVVFLSLNGHHALLRSLHDSLTALPLGQAADFARGGAASEGVISASAALFGVALLVAAPFFALIWLGDLFSAVVQRVMPDIDSAVMKLSTRTVGITALLCVSIASILTFAVDALSGTPDWLDWFYGSMGGGAP
ncbi:MAG: flagellar biosynthetic protein FliR [Myxococcales bacterium]|nr:flagellar biosynthetic protein FliR [Myxococcales bacterium]